MRPVSYADLQPSNPSIRRLPTNTSTSTAGSFRTSLTILPKRPTKHFGEGTSPRNNRLPFDTQSSSDRLARLTYKLVGWDKETAIWWAGACELTFHLVDMLFCVRLPLPPAHHGLTHAGPTLRESSGLDKLRSPSPTPFTEPDHTRQAMSARIHTAKCLVDHPPESWGICSTNVVMITHFRYDLLIF